MRKKVIWAPIIYDIITLSISYWDLCNLLGHFCCQILVLHSLVPTARLSQGRAFAFGISSIWQLTRDQVWQAAGLHVTYICLVKLLTDLWTIFVADHVRMWSLYF